MIITNNNQEEMFELRILKEVSIVTRKTHYSIMRLDPKREGISITVTGDELSKYLDQIFKEHNNYYAVKEESA